MKKCLVTGGAGFIGSHLVEGLLEKGYFVRVLDNYSSGKKKNVDPFFKNASFESVEGDVRDYDTVKKVVAGIDVVFHQAAIGSVPRSVEDPITTHDVNVTGTLNLLHASKEAKVKRFVNAASSSAYGETVELPKRETIVPQPLSPYAVSKLAQEHYCFSFFASYGLETVSLRYFNVYGPRQDPDSQYAAVIPRFFQAYILGKAPEVYGDGEQTRDFTFVKDVVRANIMAGEMPSTKGEAVNIAGGKRISVNELAKTIKGLLKSNVEIKYFPARKGDIRDSLADVSLAKKVIGWEPTTSLEQGLGQALEWYTKYFK